MSRSAAGLALSLATLLAAPALAHSAPKTADIERQFDAAISPPEMGGWMKTNGGRAEPRQLIALINGAPAPAKAPRAK